MRKLCWCCAGVSVLAAGLFLTALQLLQHPDSFLGRCAVTASGVTVLLNPAGLAVPVAERVLQVWHPEGASEESGAREVEDDVIPDDPVPVPEPAGADPAPQMPAAVTEAAPEKPAARSAPIVIPEEGPEPRPAEAKRGAGMETVQENPTPPSTRELPGAPADADDGEPTQESVAVPFPTAPPAMPYCVDEEATPCPMPYAADSREEPAEAHVKEKLQEAWRYWKGLFWTDAPSKAVPAHSSTPRASRRRPAVRDSGEEECEEPAPRTGPGKPHSFKDAEGEEGGPSHPEVDTMEFRPSDAHLSDWGPGPF